MADQDSFTESNTSASRNSDWGYTPERRASQKRVEHSDSLADDSDLNNSMTKSDRTVRDDGRKRSESQTVVFAKLCDEKDFKNDKSCKVCKKDVSGTFSAKKNCKFCGGTVCESCSRRKRPNPEDKNDFVRVCDQCHMQILYTQMMDTYIKKKEQREEYQKKIEHRLEDSMRLQQEKQRALDAKVVETKRKQKEFQEQIDIVNKQIAQNNEQIRAIEDENAQKNERYAHITSSIKTTVEKIHEEREQYDEIIKEQQEIESEIQLRDLQIQRLNQQLLHADGQYAIDNTYSKIQNSTFGVSGSVAKNRTTIITTLQEDKQSGISMQNMPFSGVGPNGFSRDQNPNAPAQQHDSHVSQMRRDSIYASNYGDSFYNQHRVDSMVGGKSDKPGKKADKTIKDTRSICKGDGECVIY